MKLHFLGAAGTVTGSKYLLETNSRKILIDCGMFQGLKELRQLNWANFPFRFRDIDLVILTHGHLDHCGALPRLVREGYSQPIWGTNPTLEVAQVILEDSARIQEEDAERANRESFSRHHPAQPLYDSQDVEQTVKLFQPQVLNTWVEIDENVRCRFRYNGHIIGATYVEIKVGEKTLVFSGDIGKERDLLMYPPQKPYYADIVVMESTYGDRLHPKNGEEQLKAIINDAHQKNGTIIIPGFAVERIQLLMYMLWKLKNAGEIPDLPIYMDSPMGSSILDVFVKNLAWHKLSLEDCRQVCSSIYEVQSIRETYSIAESNRPKIIIAGSGMATGGRVLHYLTKFIEKGSTTVVLVGFQAEGTRGRALLEGEKSIKIYGQYYTVNADIRSVDVLSSHADQDGLIDWVSHLKNRPQSVFLVHGETAPLKALREKLFSRFGWHANIPALNDVYEIDESGRAQLLSPNIETSPANFYPGLAS